VLDGGACPTSRNRDGSVAGACICAFSSCTISPSDHGASTGVLALLVALGVMLCGALAAGALWCWRRKKQRDLAKIEYVLSTACHLPLI
jgi:hypothetical protein